MTGQPLFWYRPCGEGLYEGPFHTNSTNGKLRRAEKPDQWLPLYSHPPTIRAEEYARQMLWDDQSAEEKAHYMQVAEHAMKRGQP